MKSSRLLSAFAPIFSEAAAKLVPVWLRETMSLTVFVALKEAWCPVQRRHLETVPQGMHWTLVIMLRI
jgi:hypothetical protein